MHKDYYWIAHFCDSLFNRRATGMTMPEMMKDGGRVLGTKGIITLIHFVTGARGWDQGSTPLVTIVVLCVTILTFKEMARGKMIYSEPETQFWFGDQTHGQDKIISSCCIVTLRRHFSCLLSPSWVRFWMGESITALLLGQLPREPAPTADKWRVLESSCAGEAQMVGSSGVPTMRSL